MAMNVEKKIAHLKRRVAELEGSFGYISGQLREVQPFLHKVIQVALDRVDDVENVLQPAALPIRKERRGPAGWPSAIAAT